MDAQPEVVDKERDDRAVRISRKVLSLLANAENLNFFTKTHEERMACYAPLAQEVIETLKMEKVPYYDTKYVFEIALEPISKLISLVNHSLNSKYDDAVAILFGNEFETDTTVGQIYDVINAKKGK
jgi:hypothetical protein